MKPNVLLINVDQLRAFSMGCYGDPVVQTPNIDRLSQGGVRFVHGISNNPVCVAARSILMSGQHSRTCTGALGNAAWGKHDTSRRRLRDKTLPESFKELGYHTCTIGKWHIDPSPGTIGFEESYVGEGLGHKTRCRVNEKETIESDGFQEDFHLEKAAEFFERNTEEPFFLYYNVFPPHMPLLDVPYQYTRMYNRDEVPLRDNVWDGHGHLAEDRDFFHVYLWQNNLRNSPVQPSTSKLPDNFDLRDLTALYYGAVSWCDDIVGQLVSNLEKSGLIENTLIVLTADHGDNLGSHQLFNKDNPCEESVRIPVIFHHPGVIQAGLVNDRQQAQLIDLFPTLVEYCGGEIPKHVHGQSLVPILSGEAVTIDQNLAFIETAYHQIAVRTPELKVAFQTPFRRIETPIDTELEGRIEKVLYYDLQEDPFEMNDLSESHRNDPRFVELAKKLLEWNRTTPWLRESDGSILKWSLQEECK